MALKDVLKAKELDLELDSYRIKTYFKKIEDRYVEKFIVQQKISFFNYSLWIYVNNEYISILKYLRYNYSSEENAKYAIRELIKEKLKKENNKVVLVKPDRRIISINKEIFN